MVRSACFSGALLLGLLVGLDPALVAGAQVLHVFEPELLELGQRTAAPSPRASMHDVGLARIERLQLVGEVRRLAVHQDRAG